MIIERFNGDMFIDLLKRMIKYSREKCSLLRTVIRRTKQRKGVYNAVAPEPVSNRTFMKKLARVSKRHPLLQVTVPQWVLTIILGEMSEEVLKSTTASSRKLRDSGFAFSYPTLQGALEQLQRSS